MAERHTVTGTGGDSLSVERALEPRCERRTTAPSRQRDDLQLCPACGCDLVYPLDWSPAADRRWCVALRCPECEWRGGGIYNQDVVDRFDEALDDGTQAVLDDLELLTRANMEEQIEIFVAALGNDLILPEDF